MRLRYRIRGKETPRATGEAGLVVLEALYAGYASAAEGRKIDLPFNAGTAIRPIDVWLNRKKVASSTTLAPA